MKVLELKGSLTCLNKAAIMKVMAGIVLVVAAANVADV
jgi:hypothetical protein